MELLRTVAKAATILPLIVLKTCWKEFGLIGKHGLLAYCKFILTITFLEGLKIFKKRRLFNYDLDSVDDIAKHNLIYPQEEWDLEQPQSEAHLQNNLDEVFLYGVNTKGEVLAVSFQRHAGKIAEVFLVLKTADGRQYVLPQNLVFDTSDAENYNAAGLRIHCAAPMRIARIAFNGLLKEVSQDAERVVHVKLGFVWLNQCRLLDHKEDPPTLALAEQVSQLGFGPGAIALLKNALEENSYEIPSFLEGTYIIEGQEEQEMYLWGSKLRQLGKQDLIPKIEEHYFGAMKMGLIFHAVQDIESKDLSERRSPRGYSLPGKLKPYPLKRFSIVPYPGNSDRVLLDLETGAEAVRVKVTDTDTSWKTLPRNEAGTELEVKLTSLVVGLDIGQGLHVNICRTNPKQSALIKEILKVIPPHIKEPSDEDLFLKFDDVRCQIEKLTGGKGSSLSILRAISSSLKTFHVPDGIVVTTNAYKFFEQEAVLKYCSDLPKIANGTIPGDLKKACEEAVANVRSAPLSEKIKKPLKSTLRQMFQDRDVQFAVRSSAVGEDSEEMSAAGQMDTFLGVRGFDKIAEAVVKCWASQFSYIAVQYKRQHGQEINSPMAVVIQEMVPSEKAGVMFTCDPLSGNPSKVVITSNFGLGESVVAATADPDTLTLHRDLNGNLKIESVQIGSKKVVIKVSDQGTVTEDSNDAANICSLEEEETLSLAKIGCDVEKYYGSCRDIEWAVSKGNIYLLQARPVTSTEKETDFEVVHMADIAIRSEVDVFSKANVGEVLPGALSYLGNLIFGCFFPNTANKAIFRRQGVTYEPEPYYQGFIGRFNQHHFFNMCDGFFIGSSKDGGIIQKSMAYSLLGKDYHDDEAAEVSKIRAPKRTIFNKLMQAFLMIKDPLLITKRMNRISKQYRHFQLDLSKCKTCLEMLLTIGTDSLPVMSDCGMPLCESSMSSSIFNLFIILTLARKKGDVTPEVFADFSKIVSGATDVESADVPQEIKVLAEAIAKSDKKDVFPSMSIQEALEWIKNDRGVCGIKYREFLDKHGHRCVKEFDLHSTPWEHNPEPFLKSLQAQVRTMLITEDKDQSSSHFSLDDLQIKLGLRSRLLLKLLVPLARKGVAWRERSKSILIRSIHIMRMAFRELADRMVEEGRLQDPDLMFFLSYDELYRLIKTRSPLLIARAKRRQRVHKELNSLKYPTLFKGIPKPVLQSTVVPCSLSEIFKGTPVSQGIIRARARVVRDSEEAYFIQRGEILVTFGTDTGWTPYFPLLSGVITEIGGLLSHGAVVAREYGLPCVAGLENASFIFQTGDYLLVDGTKGIVQKIEPPEENNHVQ